MELPRTIDADDYHFDRLLLASVRLRQLLRVDLVQLPAADRIYPYQCPEPGRVLRRVQDEVPDRA
jgi:hypothetical protein